MRSTAVMVLLNAALMSLGQGTLANAPTASATIATVAVQPGPVVVVSATGALPIPRVGMLSDPDRLYLDLAGVSARALNVRSEDALVTRVRVAQHSLDPLITRIVIDLTRPSRYSLNTSRLSSGRLEVALTSGAVSSGASRNQPPAAPSVTPRHGRGDAAIRRYAAEVQPALARLDVLRAVLHDIDARSSVGTDRIQGAQSELSGLRRALESARPSPRAQDAHDLLKSVVGFASTALSLSANSPDDIPPNASSAAAGALLMLERAEAELRKPDA